MIKIKGNKNLLILVVTFFMYMLLWIFFINPINLKNQELESKKIDMMIEQEEQKYIKTMNDRKKEKGDDLVLLLQKNINEIADVEHIDRAEVVKEQRTLDQIKIIISSKLKDVDKVENKIKEMALDKNIDSIEVLNKEQKNDKKLLYSITLNVE